MTLEELRKLAASFFEWPTEDRTHVTLTSALLFAQHVLRMTQQQAEPLFWVRVHPDGEPSRDILHNDRIEEVRKNSGAWKPLFLAAPTAQERKCWCHTCRPVTLDDMRMVLCPDCGNKRCPKANDHRNSCTKSNEPGQIGSAYPAPQAQPAPIPTADDAVCKQQAEQPTISAYACTVPDDCETLHWRGQILSMNELMSVAQPVVDEEIHVHIEGRDVLTLPLASSGMSAPRFVVHVPAQQPAEQQPISHDWDDQDKCRRCGDRDWYASATCSPKQPPAPIPTSERLAAGRILTCVYCGHEYPQDTPAHGSKVLTDHISQCEKHPMREVIDQRDKLKSALAGLIGASDSAELRNMELIIRLSPAPAADKAAMLDAIHVLLNVAEQPTGLTKPPAPGGSDD